MSVLVRVPTPLRAVTKGQGELKAEAATVKELIDRLEQDYAGIRARLCEADGNIRRFINIYVNEEDIRFLQGQATPLKAGDQVSIVPAIAGGTSVGRVTSHERARVSRMSRDAFNKRWGLHEEA
jgi:molybdopterin synthase sulfur carrier subunit